MRLETYLNESASKNMFMRFMNKLVTMQHKPAVKKMKNSFIKLQAEIEGTELESKILASINKNLGTSWKSLNQIAKADINRIPKGINEDFKHFWDEVKGNGMPALMFYPALQVFMEVDNILRGLTWSKTILIFYSVLWIVLVSLSHVAKWKKWKKDAPSEYEVEGSKKNPFSLSEAVIDPKLEGLVKKKLQKVLKKLKSTFSKQSATKGADAFFNNLKISEKELNKEFLKLQIQFESGEHRDISKNDPIFRSGWMLTGVMTDKVKKVLPPGAKRGFIKVEYDPTLLAHYAYYCSLGKEDVKKMENELIQVLKHEIIHRIQLGKKTISMKKKGMRGAGWYDSIGSTVNSDEDFTKAFSRKEEIMAYASDVVVELEQEGYDKAYIKKAFKKGVNSPEFKSISHNSLLRVYINIIGGYDNPQLQKVKKQFLKYLFQYLEK